MKYSIWQQFSSNHSGSFTVIGRFPTQAAAREAADALSEIVQRIDEWYEDPANQAQIQRDGPIMSPVEAEVKQTYELEWEYNDLGIDWYGSGHEPVIHFGQAVLFDVGETWGAPQTIGELLSKLGGQVYEEHEFGAPITSIIAYLTCHFDDDQSARYISGLIEDWQTTNEGEDPPWTDEQYEYAKIEELAHAESRVTLKMTAGIRRFPLLLRWLEMHGAHDLSYSFETQRHIE